MKVTVSAEPGSEPLDCPHQYVGLCEDCQPPPAPRGAGTLRAPNPRRLP
jgi:hypothetical protein